MARTPQGKGGPGGKRRGKVEVEKILAEVEQVMDLMDFGASLADLQRGLPHIPRRTLEEYRIRAHKRLEQENAEQRNLRRAHARRRNYKHRRSLEMERDKAKDAKERSLIDRAIATDEVILAKLEGTFAPEKIEVVTRQGWEDLTPAELESIRKTGRLPDGRRAEDLDRVG